MTSDDFEFTGGGSVLSCTPEPPLSLDEGVCAINWLARKAEEDCKWTTIR